MPTLNDFIDALVKKKSNLISIIEDEEFNCNEVIDRLLKTPLHAAVALENVSAVIALLKKRDINIDAKDLNGDTALHLAIDKNQADTLIKALIEGGAEVSIPNVRGKTPFGRAVEECSIPAIETFFKLGVPEAVEAFAASDHTESAFLEPSLEALSLATARKGAESLLPKLPIFKFVLLGGNNSAIDSASKAHNSANSIVIGDGKFLITMDQLNVLKGRVDSSTRFDIFAHGSSVTTATTSRHMISLLDDGRLPLTANILKEINKLVGNKPVEVHLWACHAADEMSLVTLLAKGSILIAHVTENSLMNGAIPTFGIPESIEARKPLTTTDGILDFNAVLRSSFLGAGAGIHVALNVADGINTYTSLIFNAPRKEILIEDAYIKSFFLTVHTEIYLKISSCLEKPAGIVVPIRSLSIYFAPNVIECFKFQTIACHNDYYSEPEVIATAIASDIDAQNIFIQHCVCLISQYEVKLFKFLKTLQSQGSQITQFFTGENEWINAGMQKEKELPTFIELLQKLEILKDVKTALASNADHPLTKYLIAADSELIAAAREGNVTKIEAALAKKANIDAQNKSGFSGLHWAIANKHKLAVDKLIENYANVNIKALDDETPLHRAVSTGNSGIVSSLLKAKANLDEKTTSKGSTALHIAAKAGNQAVITLLVEAGASLLATNNDGKLPLELLPAACNAELKSLLTPVVKVFAAAEDEATEADVVSTEASDTADNTATHLDKTGEAPDVSAGAEG